MNDIQKKTYIDKDMHLLTTYICCQPFDTFGFDSHQWFFWGRPVQKNVQYEPV